MSIASTKSYEQRIDKVCEFIYANLSDELSLDQLSRVANFSKFHFHRQFTAYTGITLSKYVQLLRLKRASYELVYHAEKPIIEIALDANFQNPESFSRAFKSNFAQTPSQFRKDPKWQAWHQKYNYPKREGNENMDESMEVKIVDFEETKIAVLEHRGSHALLNDSIMQFIEWRKASGLAPLNSSRTIGIPNGDPNAMEPEDFRFDICASVQAEVPENPQGVIAKNIPGGRCAVFRHLGSRDVKMDSKIYALYREWLPESGEELRDFPFYFEYINLFPEVAEHELITDIYLPLK